MYERKLKMAAMHMVELWPHCKSLKCHSAFVSVPEASPILPKTRNMGSLKLLSNMPFKQHLSSTTGRETFASKVCLRENGGRWLTGCTTGRKRPNNCWGVKVQKIFSFFSPSLLEKKAFKVQRLSDVIFHLPSLRHKETWKATVTAV